MSYQDVQHHYEEGPEPDCEHQMPGHLRCPECDLATLKKQYEDAENEIAQLQELLKNLFRGATSRTLMNKWQCAAFAYLRNHGLTD
jgi:rubredoxin